MRHAASYISSMSVVAPIIEEAWEHRRRRHRMLGVAALAAATIAGIVAVIANVSSGSSEGRLGMARSNAAVVPPSAVLSRPPYMGVSCPVANSIACDRVGLAVWLKRPAVSVTASIAGARLTLDGSDMQSSVPRAPRRAFDGYVQPAGIVSRLHVRPVAGDVVYSKHGHVHVALRHQMWYGEGNTAPAPVQLTIQEVDGRSVITHVDVSLSAGWG